MVLAGGLNEEVTMAWWEAVLDSLGLVALVVVLSFCFLFVRQRAISRSGGTFECSVRTGR
jgi:hypothetical protein